MNIIKKYPEIGDIAIKVGEDIRFLGQDATPEFVETQQCIGVVYYVNGNHVKVVGGKNTNEIPFASVVSYEIESIPSASGDCRINLNDNYHPRLTYNRVTGTKEEFVQQAGAIYNKSNNDDRIRIEFHMYNGVATVQIKRGYITIEGCKLRKNTLEEMRSFSAPTIQTQAKILSASAYTDYEMAMMVLRQSSDLAFNPTFRIDGVTQLFEFCPCSEIYYNGELGDGLRANYPTYEDYIKACEANWWEPNKGAMAHRNGRTICSMFKDKVVMWRGTEIAKYPAINWALDYDSGVAGFGKGDWWLPSLHELSLLMKSIQYDPQGPTGKINSALKKKIGWTVIDLEGDQHSCTPLNDEFIWGYMAIFASPKETDRESDYWRNYIFLAVTDFNLKF